MATALVVMARVPEPGRVKTRLGQAIGALAACNLYRAFLLDIHTRFRAGPRQLVWCVEGPVRAFEAIVGDGVRHLRQRGVGLGERMHAAFTALFDAGIDTIVLIGSDIPHVREAWLDEAEEALERVDVVLGPTVDGGYYLIAMRRPHDLFTGVPMSTGSVLSATVERARAARLSVYLLPASFDIDQAGDLARLRAELDRPDAPRLPHTRRALNRLAAEPTGA